MEEITITKKKTFDNTQDKLLVIDKIKLMKKEKFPFSLAL